MSPALRRRLAGVLLPATLAAVMAAAWRVPLPFFVIQPGPVVPVSELVHVAGLEDAGDAGLWLTAIQAQPAAVGDVAAAILDPGRDVVPWRELVPPGQDADGFLAVNRRLMEESQLTAAFAAYRFAGRPATLTAAGAEVLAVAPGSAADRAGLQPGDIITTAGGRLITFASNLNTAVAAAAGRDMDLTLLRDDRRLQTTLSPGPAAHLAELGLTVVSHDLRGTFDPPVYFEPGDVAGPSGGLAFGLFLVERLAPGSVAAAGPAAATGTLAMDGTVGSVGGVRYKAQAAAEAGARVFVVPVANEDEARSAAPHLHVVGVASLAEAVEWLRSTPLTPFSDHPYNGAGLEAIPVANRHR